MTEDEGQRELLKGGWAANSKMAKESQTAITELSANPIKESDGEASLALRTLIVPSQKRAWIRPHGFNNITKHLYIYISITNFPTTKSSENYIWWITWICVSIKLYERALTNAVSYYLLSVNIDMFD